MQRRWLTLEGLQAHQFDPIRWHAARLLWQQVRQAQEPLRGALLQRLSTQIDQMEHRLSLKGTSEPKTVSNAAEQRFTLSAWLSERVAAVNSPLTSLEPMRLAHARLKLKEQVRLSLAQPLQHAGPLHSERLVQKSLARMSEWSDAYLHRLMSYVDALATLEEAQSLARQASSPKNTSKNSSKNNPGARPRVKVRVDPATKP